MTQRGRPKKEFVKSANDRKSDQREREKIGLSAKCKITRYSAGGWTSGRKKPKFWTPGDRSRRSQLFTVAGRIIGEIVASGVGLDAFKEIIGKGEPPGYLWCARLYTEPKRGVGRGSRDHEWKGLETRESECTGFNSRWEQSTAILNSEYTQKRSASRSAGSTITILHNEKPMAIDDYRRLMRRSGARCMTNVPVAEREPAGESVELRRPEVPYAPNYLAALQDACEKVNTASKQASGGKSLLKLEPMPTRGTSWVDQVRELSKRTAPPMNGYCCVSASGLKLTRHVRDLAPCEMRMAA